MVYLARGHARPLSKYEMIKLHVLTDVFHTLDHATPVIGGLLAPWPNGPVVAPAFERLDDWCTRFEFTGQSPTSFKIETRGRLNYFNPTVDADPDEFSDSEKAALEKACQFLIPMMDNQDPDPNLNHGPSTSPRPRMLQRSMWMNCLPAS